MPEYRAFIQTYGLLVDRLITPVSISPVSLKAPISGFALWDTGATSTCIKPTLFEYLKFHEPFNNASNGTLKGIGGTISAKITIINLLLAPNFQIEYCPVYVADFPSEADVLIGMDIIGMGDLVVCNTDNNTSFSFVIPPLPDVINFADQADLLNSQLN